MSEMPNYNQFVKTANPIHVKSSWVITLPCNTIEKKTTINVTGARGLQIGRYSQETWQKFEDDINSNGIKDYLLLKLYKDENGQNRIECADGSHRIHALKNLKKECQVPVVFDIDTSIPRNELAEIFYLLYVGKVMAFNDMSSLFDQMVWLRIDEIKAPSIKALLKDQKEESYAYEKFKGTKLYEFLENLFSGKYRMYKKVEGIDFDWSMKNGRVIFKFADGNEVEDIERKYPLEKAGSDNDVIVAATQAVKQCIEKISPDMMRKLGLFKGYWVRSKMIYGEIQNLVPYSVTKNYIQLLSIEDKDGNLLKDQTILDRLCNSIGTIVVTSGVVTYEGEEVTDVKYYTSNRTSSWEFATRGEVDREKMSLALDVTVQKWKQYPEAKKLLLPDLPDQLAYEMARRLSEKISSDILLALAKQTEGNDIEDFNKNEFGIDLEDADGNIFTMDVALKSNTLLQMNIINSIKKIELEFNEFIAKKILGMNRGIVGIDYIVRFNSDSEQYLKTKSNKFHDKSFTPNELFPKTLVLAEIDKIIEMLQNFYNRTKTDLNGIQQEKCLQYIKSVAYNMSKMRNLVFKAKTYIDLMKSFAIFHNVITEDVVKDKLGRL